MNLLLEQLAERSFIPDPLMRYGMRRMLAQRVETAHQLSQQELNEFFANFILELSRGSISTHSSEANEQHYEVDSNFFELVLGKHLKYSCGLWLNEADDLDSSEENMLKLYQERAELEDGMNILELGCGWGSLSLWMAKHLPNSSITAVSNSGTQKRFIENRALESGYSNLKVITSDINDLSLEDSYDRVVSIEMFEHLRNYHELFKRISFWLKPEAKLFFHIFCHREHPFFYEEDAWITKYFFLGGIMPSYELPKSFQEHLRFEKSWKVDGTHYQKTSRAWLEKMDSNRSELKAIFTEVYGAKAHLWHQRWRMFFMACEELFGFKSGSEWMVGHYLFSNREKKVN